MKKSIFIFLTILLCSINLSSQDIGMYCFGHSLIDHASSFSGEDNTNILHWINDIALDAGENFSAGGQYGFLPSHDDLPPSANWGWATVDPVWDGDNETFAEADVTTILLTAANFIQYQPPHLDHPLDASTTALASTRTIFDWVNTEEPTGVNYYIYGNWPEMDLASAFPPTPPLQSEIDLFHSNNISGNFPDWWTIYQDSMLLSRPTLNTRLIPVGKIISELLINTDIFPTAIPFDSLYSDSAPHGRPSTYFLAGMITYMAVYEQNIPDGYDPGVQINEDIRDSIDVIRDYVWTALNDFNLPNGDSRVFADSPLAVAWSSPLSAIRKDNTVQLSWSVELTETNNNFIIEHSINGQDYVKIGEINTLMGDNRSYKYVHLKPNLGINYYRVKQLELNNTYSFSNTSSIHMTEPIGINLHANPILNKLELTSDGVYNVMICNQSGIVLKHGELIKGYNVMNIESLPSGIYFLKTDASQILKFIKQ